MAGTKIATANASVIKVGIAGINSPADKMFEAANFLSGSFTDEATTQETKAKNSTSAINTVTYHAYKGQGTWQRTSDDPVQLYLIKLSEGKIGTDCQTKVSFVGSDGITRTGVFNVSATELGFSGEADALATLEIDFTLASGQPEITYPEDVETALEELQNSEG